jgi:hypothetical protein
MSKISNSVFPLVPQGPARDKLLAKRAARMAAMSADDRAAIQAMLALPPEELQQQLRLLNEMRRRAKPMVEVPVQRTPVTKAAPILKIVSSRPSVGPDRYDDTNKSDPDWRGAFRRVMTEGEAAKAKADYPDDDFEEETLGSTEPLLVSDFVAHSPDHSYIFRHTGEPWTKMAVNARVMPLGTGKKKIAASTWLDRNDAVEQRTWIPGEPQIIGNRLVSAAGFFAHPGARVFNLYRPPVIKIPEDEDVAFWKIHLYGLWPAEAPHIELWMAHRVQRPGEKVNHALLLGGAPGIGKDAILHPLRHAVGAWNFADVSPQTVLGNFNEYVQCVVLRISEGKDLGPHDRFRFYEATKILFAAPPDTLRCNPKYITPYYVANVFGPIITTNHKTSGIYLPADDRRHYVAWSLVKIEKYDAVYWAKYWARMNNGGADAVAAYLSRLNLAGFDAKAPPPRTSAFLEMVDAFRPREESDMADVIESLGTPETLLISEIVARAGTLGLDVEPQHVVLGQSEATDGRLGV